MERETIIYRGKKYHRYPKSSRRQLRVYFWRHDKWKEPPFALHRQIWIDNFGEIPKKFVVHHKDENPLNNELSNFELISFSSHASMHASQPYRKEMGRKEDILDLLKDLSIVESLGILEIVKAEILNVYYQTLEDEEE